MKSNAILFIMVLLYSKLFAQSYSIGRTTVTLVDASRNNRSIPTEIYYPADVDGDDVPLTTAVNDRFPVISFGHGFVMTWDAYQNIWEAIVAEGFIIAFPTTEGGLTPSHSEFGRDIAFVISEFNNLDLDNTSLFYNRIDSMNCVMGHSMGGGSAFLAAQFSDEIKALATLAPAETNPSAIAAASSLGIPSLVFAGGNDCVTPPADNQLPMFEALQSDCKTYVSINGGSHCQMAESNFFCTIGEATCTPAPAITREEQHATINSYLLPWLKYELKGDCQAGAQFDALIEVDSNIAFQKTCILCDANSQSEITSRLTIDVFPNPFDNKVFVQCAGSFKSDVILELYLMNGAPIAFQRFSSVKPNEKLSLNATDDLPAGIYFLKVIVKDEFVFRKIVKL